MRTCDPKSFVSVGAPAPVPPTRLLVTYMSAQEQSSKLEAIAIKGFIIFGATICSSQERTDAWLPCCNYRAAAGGKCASQLLNPCRGEPVTKRDFNRCGQAELRFGPG